jgi:protoheme IX farnesyltransferase
LMVPIVALPYFFNFGSLIYLTLSSAMTFYYVYLCTILFKEKNNKISNIIARKTFVYSIFYLFFIFVLILADNVIQY